MMSLEEMYRQATDPDLKAAIKSIMEWVNEGKRLDEEKQDVARGSLRLVVSNKS
jgi:hypothetical protein